jgi:hypothetical protein
MQKIKFKIAYKPLTDDQVNKHKNFDALMGMYAAAPKPNFFQKLFQNKWMMFSTGIITGGLIATMIAVNTTNDNQLTNQQNQITTLNSPESKIITENSTNTPVEVPTINSENNIVAIPETINNNNDIVTTETVNSNKSSVSSENNTATSVPNTKVAPSKEPKDQQLTQTLPESDPVRKSESLPLKANIEKTVFSTTPITIINTKSIPIQYKSIEPDIPTQTITANLTTALLNGADYSDDITSDKSKLFGNSADKKQSKKADGQITGDKPVKDENTAATTEADSTSFAAQISSKANNLFEKIANGSIKQPDSLTAEQPNTKTNIADSGSAVMRIVPDDSYINRYAQLSFFTPLTTNGLEGYKYYHHISINMIQGYNGAVQGIELGGVINGDKGYVIGGQFAGVGNAIGGDLRGIQGAGVFNFSKSTIGAQFAGVANYTNKGLTGMQGAGIVNYAGGKIEGMQVSGVLNLAPGVNHSAQLMQISGVANIGVSGEMIGAQIAGIVNTANNLSGAQIGLINVAKNIKGTQIGLINIADTIDGVAIGLLSFSRNGIFDIEVYNSGLFTANAGIRIGSPYIYNTFSFGITPAADTMQYGFAFGIGGHVPVFNKFSVDIDAMAWNTFNDNNFEFTYDYFHMVNQLRILPSYEVTKFLSVFGGPTFNVEIYNPEETPLIENTVATYHDVNITTGLSLGYVVGIRLF